MDVPERPAEKDWCRAVELCPTACWTGLRTREQVAKDPYSIKVLDLPERLPNGKLELALTNRITEKTLRKLGSGAATALAGQLRPWQSALTRTTTSPNAVARPRVGQTPFWSSYAPLTADNGPFLNLSRGRGPSAAPSCLDI
jgi:hypothetical protein